MVEFRSVVSSNVQGIAYEDATSTLYVEFKGGSRYAYSSVPKEEYEAFLEASSPGQFFNNNIKDAYPTRRM